MPAAINALAKSHHAFVKSDNAFQRKARLLQSLWRQDQGLPIGEHRGRPLGSRLAMPQAKDELLNYLTDTIRDVVRDEVLDPVQRADKLYGQPRIFNDLLSSQPLCFNLFGELQRDRPLASKLFGHLTAGRMTNVTAIHFEHSPGRGDDRYTGDRSAFDVFVELTTAEGRPAFIGIEVKYHESLGDKPAPHRPRYDEIADAMGAFHPDARTRLRAKPLQQIWRDHLLAGALLATPDYDDGLFAFLYPEPNPRCAQAVAAYRSCLQDPTTFTAWTLEGVVQALQQQATPAWLTAFEKRYLDFDRIERELEK